MHSSIIEMLALCSFYSDAYKNYNEYFSIMSVIRYQPDKEINQKQRSIQCFNSLSNQQKPYSFKNFSRSRNKANTKSLQSIEFNHGSIIIPIKAKISSRRKLISFDRNQLSEVDTQRSKLLEHSSKKNVLEGHLKRIGRPERMRTIDQSQLHFKQKRIKDCIQLMQGVLQQIQNQKSQKHANFNLHPSSKQQVQQPPSKPQKQEGLSKFQNYVRNVCNVKNESKQIILRKAKAKSTVNRQAIKSSAILNAHKFQTIRHQKPKQIQPYNLLASAKKKQKPYFANNSQLKKIDQLECSFISPVNQSSFISDVGKQLLVKHLQQDSKGFKQQIQEDNSRQKSTLESNNKLILKLKNHRKLKNIFPDGFF